MKIIDKAILKIDDALEGRLYKEPIDLFENKVLIYYSRLIVGILFCWIRLYLIISGLVWILIVLSVIITRPKIDISEVSSKNINLGEVMRVTAIANMFSYFFIAIVFVVFSLILSRKNTENRYFGIGRWHRKLYLSSDIEG
mgnify:CR=1 FL=1